MKKGCRHKGFNAVWFYLCKVYKQGTVIYMVWTLATLKEQVPGKEDGGWRGAGNVVFLRLDVSSIGSSTCE